MRQILFDVIDSIECGNRLLDVLKLKKCIIWYEHVFHLNSVQ